MNKRIYEIAGHRIIVNAHDPNFDLTKNAPTFQPFIAKDFDTEKSIVFIDVDNDWHMDESDTINVGYYPVADLDYKFYMDCEENNLYVLFGDKNGNTLGCIGIDKNLSKAKVSINLSISNIQFAFSNAIMIIYTFAVSKYNTIIIHSSSVIHNKKGYLFLGKSGAGKSTHSQLWINNIPGTELLNDDNPIIRILNDKVVVYGSPWSGKTPCYKQKHIDLGAFVCIHQAKENRIMTLSPVSAFIEVLTSVTSLMCYRPSYDNILQSVINLVEKIPVYSLDCLPNKNAALICSKTICR